MPATADRASVASYAQFPAELDRDWLGRVCHLSGPDLAVILYASALKLALLGTLVLSVAVPRGGLPMPFSLAALALGLPLVGIAVGLVESVMARLRLTRVPQVLVAAAALSAFGVVLLLR